MNVFVNFSSVTTEEVGSCAPISVDIEEECPQQVESRSLASASEFDKTFPLGNTKAIPLGQINLHTPFSLLQVEAFHRRTRLGIGSVVDFYGAMLKYACGNRVLNDCIFLTIAVEEGVSKPAFAVLINEQSFKLWIQPENVPPSGDQFNVILFEDFIGSVQTSTEAMESVSICDNILQYTWCYKQVTP